MNNIKDITESEEFSFESVVVVFPYTLVLTNQFTKIGMVL